MARIEGTYAGRMDDWGDNTRPFDTTSRYFREGREDRPVFRPLPRGNWRGQPRSRPRNYDRYFPRSASR
jgi:hypothetical protein